MAANSESTSVNNAPSQPANNRQRMNNNTLTGAGDRANMTPGANRGYGRGRGAGRAADRGPGEAIDQNDRNLGGRRVGRGTRGNKTASSLVDSRGQNSAVEAPPPLPPPPGLGGRGSFGGRLTGDATTLDGDAGKKGKGTGKPGGDEDLEADVCFICASPVDHHSVHPCNHRTCHICSLRMRALYKTNACAYCKTIADHVIFTDDPLKKYEDYTDGDFAKVDSHLGIKYEKDSIYEDTILLLRYNCPDPTCVIACLSWPDLHRHVKAVHQKVMCNLCTRNKKVFTHEHDLFTMPELRRHEKFGDDNPGAIDQSGFKGHPECGFCRERFYDDDELYTHCREKHERCHICDRRNAGRQPQYYIDYNSLEQHFKKDHFLCSDQECLEKKFVVFDSEIDLKAHQLESHPNGLTKDARREARRIDISGFDYRPHTQVDDRGGRRDRDGRGRGRGRDPNSEPLPPSSAQPLRRDELAYQRQMAIQTSQSVVPRTFGGQLTVDAPTRPNNRPADGNNAATSTLAPRQTHNFPSFSSLSLGSSQASSTPSSAPPQQLSPQEQARRLRHASVIERAAVLFRNDPRKMNDFQAKVSAYKASSTKASEFLDWIFTTCGAAEAEIGKLIKELAELYESEPKRKELLQAWNDWKAVHEDYPALPSGAPASSSASWVKQGGTRVLSLKSRTAQSRRANSSAAPLGLSSTGVSASANRVGAGRANAPAWVSQTASSSRRTQTPPASRGNSIAPSSRVTAPKVTSDAFPALPPGKAPQSSIFGSGFRVVKKNTGKGPATNAWGAKGGSSSENVSGNEDGEDMAEGENEGVNQKAKRKGNKNKKQVLMQWG